MHNFYEIVDLSDLGLPFKEVHGDSFHYLDLYELVGNQQFMTTFNFRDGSEASGQYGESVTGVIYYDSETLQKLKSAISDDIDLTKLRIDTPDAVNDLSEENRQSLKYEYGGIKVADIQYISFLSYQRETERHDTGEKKIPNVIEIPVDCDGIDPDVLCHSYLVKKNNDEVELIQFEKEQLIGITLAIRDGIINSRILNHFGFDKDSAASNMNIRYHWYKVKERRGTLSEDQKKQLSEIQNIRDMDGIIALGKELIACGVNEQELVGRTDTLQELANSVTSFKPSILLHGKKQVYWDLDSYVHIVMRHVKDYQLGKYKEKTPFPYKVEDLKMLIEKVLGRIENEYKLHASQKPNSVFLRQGTRAVAFNGDHYDVRISSDGRLMQFNARGKNL